MPKTLSERIINSQKSTASHTTREIKRCLQLMALQLSKGLKVEDVFTQAKTMYGECIAYSALASIRRVLSRR